MFAIMNWKTNEFLYDTIEEAADNYTNRECNGDFVIGQVGPLIEIKQATRPVFRSAINGDRPAEPVQR